MQKSLRKFIDIFSKNNRECVFCAFLAILFISGGIFEAGARKRSRSYENYVERYRKIAVEQRKKYGIPASITLAQGLLESGAGQSRLAREANNHFGIKCGGTWKGKTIKHDDDKKKECFRKYKKVEDSYEDHSRFLKRKRYEPLFEYKITDYKNWAKGLRKCGYATDRKYPEKLISIIELYGLARYDKDGFENDDKLVNDAEMRVEVRVEFGREVHLCGKLKYVIATEGDSYEKIARQCGLKSDKLRSINDVEDTCDELVVGEIVHLKKKNKKYAGKGKYYEVKKGETLYSISQKLGVQLKQLQKRNNLDKTSVIMPGDRLKVK